MINTEQIQVEQEETENLIKNLKEIRLNFARTGEYFLIGFRTTIGKQGYKVIDKVVAQNLKQAEKDLKYRNKEFKKLIVKHNLIICEARRWIE